MDEKAVAFGARRRLRPTSLERARRRPRKRRPGAESGAVHL